MDRYIFQNPIGILWVYTTYSCVLDARMVTSDAPQGDLVIMFSDGLRDNLHDREAKKFNELMGG